MFKIDNKKQHRKSTAAVITLLLCFCIFAAACALFAVAVFSGAVHFSAVTKAFSGASPLFSVAVGGQELNGGQLAVLILVGIFGCAALAAMVLFLLIFPIINRLFKTHLPCVGMFNREYEDAEEGDKQTKESKGHKSSAEKRADKAAEAVRKAKEESRKRALETKRQHEKERESTSSLGANGYEDDRYVKTVRIDTLYNPKQQPAISSTRIDQAMRAAINSSPRKTAPQKPDKMPDKAPNKFSEAKKNAANVPAEFNNKNVKDKDAPVKAKRNTPQSAPEKALSKAEIALQKPKSGVAKAKPNLANGAANHTKLERIPEKTTAVQKKNAEKERAANKKTPLALIQAISATDAKQTTTEKGETERLSYLEKKVQDSAKIAPALNSIEKKQVTEKNANAKKTQ